VVHGGSEAVPRGGGGANHGGKDRQRRSRAPVDLVVNTEKFRGSTIKQNFPLV